MKIFISYASQDKNIREEISESLIDLHNQVWSDNSLKSGQEWWNEILEEIRRCEVFITLISMNYKNSEACDLELQYAVALGKPILPIKIEAISNQLISFELSKRQVMDYASMTPTKQVTGLVSALKGIAATDGFPSALPDVLPEEPLMPVSYKVRIYNRLKSSEPLDLSTQKTIIDELRQAIHDKANDHAEIRQLLKKMLNRGNEITFNTAREVEELLRKIEPIHGHSASAGASVSQINQAPHEEPKLQQAFVNPKPNVQQTHQHSSADMKKAVNAAWWIAPVIFGIIGGVIAWAVNKKADADTARGMLITGIVINIFLWFLMSGA